MSDGLLSPDEIEALLGESEELSEEREFAELERSSTRREVANLDFLMEVPLHVTVQLGEARMQLRDLLKMGKGSIVELQKMAEEPVDVLVNGKVIAKGEVVTIDENLAVRITEILSTGTSA